MRAFRPLTCENGNGPGRCVNTNRGLTHHLMRPGRGAWLMVAIPRPPRPADLSPERRQTVLSLLSSEKFGTLDLTAEARLMYAVSALVCDDIGRFTQDDLDAAYTDPSVIQCAVTLLTRAGY